MTAFFQSPGGQSGIVDDLPQLRSTITELKDENRELTQCLEAMMKERKAELVLHKECDAEMMMLLGGLEASMGQLEKDYRQARYDADHAEKKRQEDIEKLMKDMDIESAMKGSEKAKLMDEILVLRRAAEEEKRKFGVVSKEKARLEADLAVLKSENSTTDSVKAKLMDEVVILRSAAEEEKRKAGAVSREKSRLEADLAVLKAESLMKDSEKAKMVDEIAVLRRAAEEERQQSAEIFREKTRLEGEDAEFESSKPSKPKQKTVRLEGDMDGESHDKARLLEELRVMRKAAEEEKQQSEKFFREKTRLESELAELQADKEFMSQQNAGRIARQEKEGESELMEEIRTLQRSAEEEKKRSAELFKNKAELLDEIGALQRAAEEEKERSADVARAKTRLESELAELKADKEFMSQQNATQIARQEKEGESELMEEIRTLQRSAEEEKKRSAELFKDKAELLDEIRVLQRSAEDEKKRSAEVLREKTRLESELAEIKADKEFMSQQSEARNARKEGESELMEEIRVLRKAAEEEKQMSEKMLREKTRLESELAEIQADKEFMSQQNTTRIVRKEKEGESGMINEILVLRKTAEGEKKRSAEVLREKTRMESELAELSAATATVSEQNTMMRKQREEVAKRAVHIRSLREQQTKDESLVRPDVSLIKTETERFLDDVAALSTDDGGSSSFSPTTAVPMSRMRSSARRMDPSAEAAGKAQHRTMAPDLSATANEQPTDTERDDDDQAPFHLFDSEADLPPSRSRHRTSAHRHPLHSMPVSRIGALGERTCVPAAKVELAALDELFEMKSRLVAIQSKVV